MAEPISQTNTPTIVANVDKGLASGNASFWENAARLNSATPLNAAESPEAFKVYQDIQQNPGRFISNTFDNFSGYEKQVLQKATIEANNSALKKRDPYIDIPRATPHSVEIYNPDKIDTFLPRYQNWDRGLFEQLGFDPNGGNDERYNAKSTAFMNFKRTLKGTGAIALETIGQNFVSYDDVPSILPGVDKTIDIEQASMADKAVKSIMSQYQLTHGGNAAEFGNDLMQAGFTIGSAGEAIITSIVADAVLLAMTPETGGASAGAAIVTTAARFTNLVKKIKNVQKLMEITKASSTIGKVANAAGKLGFAPRTIGTIRNFGSIAKAGGTIRATGMLGVNIATDLAIAGNFTGEAGLEAGATFNETRDKLIEQYININGYEPKGEDYADILARATTAAQKDYNVNAYMLYVANKLNMGLFVRPHMAKVGYALGRYDGNIIDKGVKNRLTGRYAEYEHGRGILGIRRMAEDIEKVGFKKGFLKPAGVWIGEGAVEGLQEVWQEVATQSIQEHTIDDFLHDNDKLAAVGSWIDYINDAHQQVWDTEGTKLFLMGFMTQAVTMAPIQTMQSIVDAGGNAIQGRPQDTSNVGGWTMDKIENLIHRVKGKEEFEKYKTEKEKKLKQTKDIISKRTEILNEINKNPDLLFNPILQNLLSVHDFDTALKEMEANDMDATKVYHDIKDEASFKYLQMLVQTNQVDAFKDTIRDIKANTTEDDIRKTYSSSTLTKVQYDKMLDKYVERLDRIEERKRNADNRFVNIYPTGSELSIAFEGAKWSFILMGNRYDRALERMNKIYSLVYDEKFKDSLDKTVDITTFDSLFKSDVREQYIESLEKSIALASEDIPVVTDELRTELKAQKDKLEVLQQIDSAVKNFEKEKDGKKFSNEIKKLFRERIAKGYDKKFSNKELDILANAITDYTVLGFEAKGLNENISILMNDQDVYNNIVNKEFEFFEKLKENHGILIDKILNATLKHNASQVVQVALDKAGIKVAITPDGLKAMNNKEQLPLRDNFIQYKEVDGVIKHEELSEETYEKAIALIKQLYADKGIILKDSLISKSEQDYSKRETGTLMSIDDIIKRFELDKQTVESNVGQVVSIKNLIPALEKRLYKIDAEKVSGTIVFCTNLEEPVKRKDGKLFIDIRFFSNNYVQEQNPNGNIEGFKQWNNRQQQINELFESNPGLANEVYEALGFGQENNIKAKKADIERRRREAFKTSDNVFSEQGKKEVENYFLNPDNYTRIGGVEPDGKIIGVGKGTVGIDGSFVRYNKEEWREQRVLNKKLESGIITRAEYRELNKALEERVLKRGLAENKVVTESELNSAKNINAKYDAELKELEAQTTSQQKKEAQQLYSQYLEQNPNGNIEGFKNWAANNKSKPEVSYSQYLEQNLSIDSFIEEELYKNYLGNIEKGSLAYLKIEQLVDEISKVNKKVSGENVIASFSSLISNKKLLSSLNEDLRNELDTFFSNFRKFGDNLTKSESPVNKVVADIKKNEKKSEVKEPESMEAVHEINLDTIDKDSTMSKEELVKEASSLKVEELEDFIKKYSSNPELKEAISSAFADDEVKKTAMAIFNRIEKESQELSLDNAAAAFALSAVQSCK